MTTEQFENLNAGDIVKHMSDNSKVLIVTTNYGKRNTAVYVADMTNPVEWELVLKARHEKPLLDDK